MYKARKAQEHKNFVNGEVSRYLKNMAMRRNTPYTINGKGEGHYIVDGKAIPTKEFEAMYPISLVRASVKGARIGGAQQIY